VDDDDDDDEKGAEAAVVAATSPPGVEASVEGVDARYVPVLACAAAGGVRRRMCDVSDSAALVRLPLPPPPTVDGDGGEGVPRTPPLDVRTPSLCR
jgi:hypothetical protein